MILINPSHQHHHPAHFCQHCCPDHRYRITVIDGFLLFSLDRHHLGSVDSYQQNHTYRHRLANYQPVDSFGLMNE